MNARLVRFLRDHENQQVWLLIPHGIIIGTLPFIPGDAQLSHSSDWEFELTNAKLDLLDRTLTLGVALIHTNQICAWGIGGPRYS